MWPHAIAIESVVQHRIDAFNEPEQRNENGHHNGPVANRVDYRIFRRNFGRRRNDWFHTSTVLKDLRVKHRAFDVDRNGLRERDRFALIRNDARPNDVTTRRHKGPELTTGRASELKASVGANARTGHEVVLPVPGAVVEFDRAPERLRPVSVSSLNATSGSYSRTDTASSYAMTEREVRGPLSFTAMSHPSTTAPTCARPTCAVAATARFFFDGQAGVLVLDTKIHEYGGSGVLCDRHAELLRAPQGWTVEDRRVVAPRLFPINRFEEPVRSLTARAKRLLTPIAQHETPLPLQGGPAYELPSEYEDAPIDAARAVAIEVHPDQATFDLPDQRTPLLARAFESASQRVRPTSALSSLIPQHPSTQPADHIEIDAGTAAAG
jgi:hypothetical protein